MFPLKFPSQTSNPASARRKPEEKPFSSELSELSRFTESFSAVSDDPVGGAAEEPVLEEDDRPLLGVFSEETVEGEDVAVRGRHPVLSSGKPSSQDQLHLNIYSSLHVVENHHPPSPSSLLSSLSSPSPPPHPHPERTHRWFGIVVCWLKVLPTAASHNDVRQFLSDALQHLRPGEEGLEVGREEEAALLD